MVSLLQLCPFTCVPSPARIDRDLVRERRRNTGEGDEGDGGGVVMKLVTEVWAGRKEEGRTCKGNEEAASWVMPPCTLFTSGE